MRVFVTGLTGFVGHHIASALIAAEHDVVALVRSGSENKLGALQDRVTLAFGDATIPETIQPAMAGCDAVIHLVGIIREVPSQGVTFERLHWEASRNVIDAARAQGIKRFLHMSANGAKPVGTPYQTTKFLAEEHLRGSGLDWTIFRPSIIFGAPEGRTNFESEIAAPMRLAPFFPVFGNGEYPMQPVHVDDVAAAFVRALSAAESVGKTYCLGGPDVLSYREVLTIIAAAIGKPWLPLIPVPLPLVELGVQLGEGLKFFPLTKTQLAMLLEGNICPDMAWARELGIAPKAFTPEALAFLREA